MMKNSVVYFLILTLLIISLIGNSYGLTDAKIGYWEKNIKPIILSKFSESKLNSIYLKIWVNCKKNLLQECHNSLNKLAESVVKVSPWSFEISILSTKMSSLLSDNTIEIVSFPRYRLISELNDVGRDVGLNDLINSNYNATGAGIIVGQFEFAGTDGAQIQENHSDLQGRILPQISYPGRSYHATHVAGIMGGNGASSYGIYRGMASEIKILNYDTTDVHNDFIDSLSLNNSLAQNSWGVDVDAGSCENIGSYTAFEKDIDDIVRGTGNRPLPIVFSGGNLRNFTFCGIQSRQGYNSTNRPKTAKNVISVGAVNSDSNSMTFFSSWGPTNDGRIKPDLVAPGCEDDLHRDDSDPDKSVFSTTPDGYYFGDCGTSMAAPVVSGIAALLIKQYRMNFSVSPFPSTIKGILIHTAEDLDISGKGVKTIDGPDFKQGYGLVDAKGSIDQVIKKGVIEGSLTFSGENKTYYTRIDNGEKNLKVTLVWDDMGGDPAASKMLKNDLDLIVYDNNSVRVFPWTLDPNNPSFAATQNKEDHLNNVEQVFKGNNSVGVWTIIVNATNLTSAQNFSLIVDNFYDPNPPSSPTVWASPKKVGRNISVFWLGAKDLETGISEYQYQLDNTTNASYISVGQSRQIYITNTSDGKHAIYVRAIDYYGNPSQPGNATFIFDSVAPTQANNSANFITPVGTTINVDTNENGTAHIEYGTTASYGSIVGAEEFRQHQSVALTGLSTNTLYHYRVKSADEAQNNISSADNTFTTGNNSNLVHSFSGSLAPFVQASPFVNATITRPGQWDLAWDISMQNATLNVYDPQGGLFASKTAPPGTTRFYLDNGMLGTYTFQVTYTPAANATLGWSISSTITPWTTAYSNEYDDSFREAKSLVISQTIDGYLTAWNGSTKDDMNGDQE